MRYTIIYFLLISMMPLQKLCSQSIVFNRTYGEDAYNYGQKIIETPDKGFLILGNTSADLGNNQIIIIKTDSNGIIEYEKKFGSNYLYWANDFIATSDNGYIITGLTNKNIVTGYDILVIKLNNNCEVVWERTYGGSDWDISKAIIETKNQSIIIAGETFSYPPGNQNIYLLHIAMNGDTLWTRAMGGDSSDYATSADLWYDGTVLIGANTKSYGAGNYDGYVININLNGDTIWTETYGEEKEDILNSIKQTPDSGYVFVGTTMSYCSVDHDFWLMRFGKSKNLLWKIPEPWIYGPLDDYGYCVTLNDTADFVLVGNTIGFGNGGKEIIFTVMGDYGTTKCIISVGSQEDDVGYYAIQTTDGGYIIVGFSEGYGTGIANIYVNKVAPNCMHSSTTQHTTSVNELNNNESNSFFEVNPNISEGIFNIKVSDKICIDNYRIVVTNILGKIVYYSSTNIYPSSLFQIDISDEADGLYYISLSNREHFSCKKGIKQ